MRQPSQSGLTEVEHPRGSVKGRPGGDSVVGERRADPGIASMAPPLRRRSTDEQGGSQIQQNAGMKDGWAHDTLDSDVQQKPPTDDIDYKSDRPTDSKPWEEEAVRVDIHHDSPVKRLEEEQKSTRCGSRRTRLVVFGVLLVCIIIAIVVPVVVTRQDSSNESSAPGTGGPTSQPGTQVPNPTPQPGTRDPTAGTSPPTAPPGTREPTNGNETPEPQPPGFQLPTEVTALDQNLLDFTLESAELAYIVNQNDTNGFLPTASVFESSIDKAMVVQLDNVCFGVFRATTRSIGDWLQNIDSDIVDVCSNLTGECCQARKGFYEAYDAPYRVEFEEALHQCVEDCPSCNVVFAGNSQGGAVAHIAGVINDHLNPVILTIGQPYTMAKPCEAIKTDRMFRFINTIVRGDKLLYDTVSFLRRGSLSHFGHLFVLGEGVNSVAYYPPGEARDLGRGEIAGLRQVTAVHFLVHYRARLAALRENGTLPISIGGFEISETCQHPTECVFPHICGRRKCTRGQTDDPCNNPADCLSGNCTFRLCI